MLTSASPLDRISIASPCTVDWETMSGNDRVRHCDQCELNVYDLSSMHRADAERLLRDSEGRLCVRLHRRHDGTVITQDCPVGLRAVRQRVVRRVRSLSAAVITLVAGAFGYHAASAVTPKVGRVAIAVQGEPELARDSTRTQDTLVQIELPERENVSSFLMGVIRYHEPMHDAADESDAAIDVNDVEIDDVVAEEVIQVPDTCVANPDIR